MTLKYEHLAGRPFTGMGEQDCFALAINFFKDNFDITIPNYARPKDWSSDRLDLMRILPEKCGFETITDWKPKTLRPGDVLCMSIGESNPNHFAIYLGDNQLIHHLYGRMSRVEPFNGHWRNRIAFILRHKDVPDLTPVYPSVSIADLLSARNAPPTE